MRGLVKFLCVYALEIGGEIAVDDTDLLGVTAELLHKGAGFGANGFLRIVFLVVEVRIDTDSVSVVFAVNATNGVWVFAELFLWYIVS